MEANKMSEDSNFTGQEYRVLLTLVSVYALRIFGLFMVLPVFALYAKTLQHSTPSTIGIALGIYGFTQAVFQLPLGVYSDKYGRRPILLLGLCIFALGSFIGFLTQNIYGLMLARALQGAGAIGAVLMATLSDVIAEKKRARAMALLGISIGALFMFAMMLGPLFEVWIGVSGIFLLIAILSGVAILIVYTTLKESKPPVPVYFPSRMSFKALLGNKKLQHLNLGVFVLHAILTALFLIIPVQLEQFGMQKSGVFKFYVSVMLLSSLLSYGIIFYGEKSHKTLLIFKRAILCLCSSLLFCGFSFEVFIAFSASLFLFFLAFNVLEALLPALVVKEAPIEGKGRVLGIYSTSQFLGVFLGGSLGGWLNGHYGMMAVVLFCGIMAMVWGIFMYLSFESSISSKK